MEQIKYYMAPMEGVTGYVFRNAYAKYYGGIERYFTPFVANKKLGHREKNDVCGTECGNGGRSADTYEPRRRFSGDRRDSAGVWVRYGRPEPRLPSGWWRQEGAAPDSLRCRTSWIIFWKRFLKNVRSGSPSRHGSEKRTLQESEQLLAIYEKISVRN